MHCSAHMKVKKIPREQKWRANDHQGCPKDTRDPDTWISVFK